MLSKQLKAPLRIFLLFLFFWGIAPQIIMAQSPAEVEIEADFLEYDPETGLLEASGNVRLNQGDLNMKAHQLVYDEKKQLVQAGGGVQFISPSLSLTGERLWYSLLKKEGEIMQVKGDQNSILFSSSIGQVSGDEIVMEKANLARCELAVPCISIMANELLVSGKTATIKGGWLEIKRIPVFPLLFPWKFSIEANDYKNWPEIETGIDQDRGLYLSGKINHQLRDDLDFQFGGGAGTNSWALLETGLRWGASNTGGLFFDASYFRNLLEVDEVFRSTLGISRKWGRISGEYKREWTGKLLETKLVKTILSLSGGLTGEVFYQINTESSPNAQEKEGVTHGARLGKAVVPGISAGVGLIHGAGALSGFRGWRPETTFSGRFFPFPTWNISVDGSYRWGDRDGCWLTRKLEVRKDLHCFGAKVGYDWVGKKYSFKVEIKR